MKILLSTAALVAQLLLFRAGLGSADAPQGCEASPPSNVDACEYQDLGAFALPTSKQLQDFADDMSVNHQSEVVLPSAKTWRSSVKLFVDLFTWRQPLLVMYASNEGAVAKAVKFANKHSVKVSVRSGGNSNLGWGSCDGCLVVDLSKMQQIDLDVDKLQARVQPGVTNRMLVEQVSTRGIAVPQGDCPMV